MANLERSNKKAVAVYSDMNKLKTDINAGLWAKSEYAIIYIENLAYIYTISGWANQMTVSSNGYSITNSANPTVSASFESIPGGLQKINNAYLSSWS